MLDKHLPAVSRALAVVTITIVATLLVQQSMKSPLVPDAPALPYDCPTSAQERYDRSDVIVTATVDFVLPAPNHRAKVIAVPLQVWKGSLAYPTMTVMASAVDQLPTGDELHPLPLNFQSGQVVYLIYGHRLLDGTYETRPCDGSRIFGSGFLPDEAAIFGSQPVGVDVKPGQV